MIEYSRREQLAFEKCNYMLSSAWPLNLAHDIMFSLLKGSQSLRRLAFFAIYIFINFLIDIDFVNKIC